MLPTSPARPLAIPPPRWGLLAPLLQRGVDVPCSVPCSVIELLCGQLGIDPGYVERRISTIFLDDQVVDVPAQAMVRDGSVLALSAAMPGLVGATLRKQGVYAAMRRDITHAREAVPLAAPAPGVVRLKLFNLLIGELTGALLHHGFLLAAADAETVSGFPAPGPSREVRRPVLVGAAGKETTWS